MSKIIYNDGISEYATITHTTSSGTITEITDPENIANRAVLNGYEYSISTPNSGTSTITIGWTNPDYPTCSAVGLIGLYSDIDESANITIKTYNSSLVLVDTITTIAAQRTRIINDLEYNDFLFTFDEQEVRQIKIEYDNSITVTLPQINPYIGKVYVGKTLDVDVKPSSIKYSFGTQGDKQRTLGGQIYASTNNSYLRASFTTTAIAETSVVSTYFNLNYIDSISEPLIFAPQSGGNILLYGTQEKPSNTSVTSPIGKQDGEWLYETSFQIEEEI
jgi:hypothetical protein